MKKTIITIIAIISVITLNSCGNNAKEQRLLEMRDSIQNCINWRSEIIMNELHRLDSLAKVDNNAWMYSDGPLETIEALQKMVAEDRERLFQIELELNKK